MGACASAPSTGVELTGRTCPQDDFPATRAPPSRRHLIMSPDDGKRSTADTIAAAFVAQATSEADFDPTKALTTRLASRNRALNGRRASAQASQLGIASAPAAESMAGLKGFRGHGPAGDTVSDLAPDPWDGPDTAGHSFEMACAETARRFEALQKSFRNGTGTGEAWCTAESQRGDVAADRGPGGGGGGGGTATKRAPARGASTAADTNPISSRDSDGDDDVTFLEDAEDGEEGVSSSEELVVPVGADVSGNGRCSSTDTAGLKTVRQQPTGCGAGGAYACEDGWFEKCGTPRRVEGSAASAVHVRQLAKDQASTCAAAAAAAASAADGVPAAAGGGSDVAARRCESETDELTSLPLPNLVNTCGGGPSALLLADHRYSEVSYVPQRQSGSLQGVLEPEISGLANRNSDLGFYLDDARLSFASASSPSRGAQPIRHHLLGSPMARLRAEQAAKEAEAARPAVQVLDYVPAMRSQASRGNLLLTPPSTKGRQQLLGRAYDLGGGEMEVDESAESDSASRRLEYRPTKSFSRMHLQVQRSGGLPTSAAALLSLPSRLTSPSRLVSPSSSSLLGPGSLTGASSAAQQRLACESSSRCFFAAMPREHDAGSARAATVSGGMPATASSVSLRVTASGVSLPAAAASPAMPLLLATASTATAAAPITPTRTRTAKRLVGADPRVTASNPQVHFGPVEMLVMESLQQPACTAAASSELSPRPRRSAGLTAAGLPADSTPRLAEHRPSAPLLSLVPGCLQQPGQNDDGDGTGGGGDSGKRGGGNGGARRRVPEEIMGTAWSEPSSFLSAPTADGGGVLGSGDEGPGSRAANRAARLLASLHRLGGVTPEQRSTVA